MVMFLYKIDIVDSRIKWFKFHNDYKTRYFGQNTELE